MKRSFTVLGLALLLAACARRPGFIPTEAVEAAVAPNCLMECRQLDMTCRAGCLHDWQCVSDVCHGPYSDCLYRCPITNYAAIEPWVKPTPAPEVKLGKAPPVYQSSSSMSCDGLPADPDGRERALNARVNSGEITWADYYRCVDGSATAKQ